MEERCTGPDCTARAVALVRGEPMCLAHYRKMEWQLAALGMKLGQFEGNVLDLLDADRAQAHLGKALADESEVARRIIRRALRKKPRDEE